MQKLATAKWDAGQSRTAQENVLRTEDLSKLRLLQEENATLHDQIQRMDRSNALDAARLSDVRSSYEVIRRRYNPDVIARRPT